MNNREKTVNNMQPDNQRIAEEKIIDFLYSIKNCINLLTGNHSLSLDVLRPIKTGHLSTIKCNLFQKINHKWFRVFSTSSTFPLRQQNKMIIPRNHKFSDCRASLKWNHYRYRDDPFGWNDR